MYFPWFVELVDHHLKAQNSSVSELVALFENAGYTVTRWDIGNPINQSMDFSNCHYDIFAIPAR